MQTITVNETSASLRRVVFALELASNQNEIQSIDLGDIGTGDTFTLTYNGSTTSAISYAADMTTAITTALEALPNIANGEVTVAKQAGQVYNVTFTGTLALLDLPLMTIAPTGFTPVGITEVQHGGVSGSPMLRATFTGSDISISQNGSAPVNSTGTVTEIGRGLYYYTLATSEVTQQGVLAMAIIKSGAAVVYPTVQVVPASSALGAPVIRSGTVQAANSSSITMDSGASTVNNFYRPSLAFLRSGLGAGQARLVHSYNGATYVLFVEPEWTIVPDTGTVYDLLPVSPLMADALRSNHQNVDTFGDVVSVADIADEIVPRILADEVAFDGADINDIQSRIPAALINGRMAADVMAINGSTNAASTLKSHTESVLTAVVGSGSTAGTVLLHASNGVNGSAPSSVDGAYNNRVLVFTSGALEGQSRRIVTYTAASYAMILESPLTQAPVANEHAMIV